MHQPNGNPYERPRIFDIIEKVSASGTTVLLVEQNAKKALSISSLKENLKNLTFLFS